MNRLSIISNLLVTLTFSALMMAGCANKRESMEAAQPAPLIDSTMETQIPDDTLQAGTIEENWGIQIKSAMLSAGGYMVDFRFRVLDADKATEIFNRKTKPYLIDQATGAKFAVPVPPKVGPLRSGGNIKEGKTYFVFFANPAKYVKSGNKVTIVIGDFRAEDVVVQ